MPALTTLQELFVHELRDTYDAERQITKALPKLAKKVTSPELKAAFEEHRQQTMAQVERLERAFEELDLKAKGVRCHGMAGLIEEGQSLVEEDPDDDVLDAGLLAAAQKVEHYEIASYGTLVTWARQLGHDSIAELLEETLNEEKETDSKLTELAEGLINQEAEDDEAAPAPARGRRAMAMPRARSAAVTGRGRR